MVKRQYDGRNRQEAARNTKQRIVAEARTLFVSPGYAATRMGDIAQRAEVSVATVHALFGTKLGLLSAVMDQTVAGDDDPVPLAERRFVDDINALPDARTKLARYASHLSTTLGRVADIQLALQAAASADADAAEVFAKNVAERRAGMGMFAQGLIGTGHVRSDLRVDQVTDILWLAMDAGNYDWLVRRCGWTDAEFERWYVDSVAGAILR